MAKRTILTSDCSWNQGQVCCAGSRIFVHANIYDEFLKRFSKKAEELKIGDPFSKESFQGAQVSEAQYNVSISSLPHPIRIA